jgi:hypothetical protein
MAPSLRFVSLAKEEECKGCLDSDDRPDPGERCRQWPLER